MTCGRNKDCYTYHIKEIGIDRLNASQLITDLQGDGFITVPIGLYKLLLEWKMIHGGNPVLKCMAGNVVANVDAADNNKPAHGRNSERLRQSWVAGVLMHEQISRDVFRAVYQWSECIRCSAYVSR